MSSLVTPIAALLAGVALLLFGSGLLGTLVAVRGTFEGFSASVIGLIGSAYFLGFLAGTRVAPMLIRRIGHIRTFAFLTAGTAALVLAHALIVAPTPWLLLRFATGIALVGLYTVIESWLNSQAPNEHRGRVFAIYMAVNLFALAAGQQLLRLYAVDAFALFALVAILLCTAVLPVTWTRLPQPTLPAVPQSAGVKQVYIRAPSAITGGAISGLAMGAFWGLGPLFIASLPLGEAMIATFMTITIAGGALLQLPLGWLSDRLDRRLVLAIVAAGAAAMALLSLPGLGEHPRWLLFAFFLYGGLAFALYPIAVAHLMDRIEPDQMLPASSTVLFVHGVGAAVGPAIAGVLLGRFGAIALPLYFAGCLLTLSGLVLHRLRVGRPFSDQSGHYIPMLRTTPLVLEMHPDAPDDDNAGGDERAAAK